MEGVFQFFFPRQDLFTERICEKKCCDNYKNIHSFVSRHKYYEFTLLGDEIG